MRIGDAWVVAKREYTTRLKGWGFWVATAGLPLFMAVALILPSLLLMRSRSAHRLGIVDTTGELAPALVERLAEAQGGGGEGVVEFAVRVLPPEGDAAAQRARLDRMVLDEEIDAWVWLSREDLERGQVEYHAESVSSWLTQERLENALSAEIDAWRLSRAGFDSKVIGELTRGVDLETVRVSEAGSRAEAGMGGFFLAVGLFLMLYTMLIVYGSQVMQGVLEEKSSRIVEVVTSAVSPLALMAGKLAGIGLVGLTQMAIWMAAAGVLTAPGLVAGSAMLPEGVEVPTVGAGVMLHFLALFLIGYFLFSSLYAMVGAACNDMREAQQLASFAIIFLVAPMFFFMQVINDPDGKLAVVTSLIPFFTPLVMMLRLALKTPPAWQIALGYGLSLATIALLVWVCARVYRVGILMYGKRPTFGELWRWIRYA